MTEHHLHPEPAVRELIAEAQAKVWDEDTTVGVESAFPIIARIIARERAAAWGSAVQAVAWCLDNGEPSATAALAYAAENNPHRAHPEPKEAP